VICHFCPKCLLGRICHSLLTMNELELVALLLRVCTYLLAYQCVAKEEGHRKAAGFEAFLLRAGDRDERRVACGALSRARKVLRSPKACPLVLFILAACWLLSRLILCLVFGGSWCVKPELTMF